MTNPGDQVCFVADHEYGSNAQGDHMIRVVSPQGVFAECVGTPGAELVIRAPQDQQGKDTSGGESDAPAQSQPVPENTGAAQSRRSDRASGNTETGDAEGSDDGAATQAESSKPLKLKPDTRVGLRAIVVFPSGDVDDERDVTNAAEFRSSRDEVATVNTTTGVHRGQLTTRKEGATTITARYSGMVAKRKVRVVGQTPTALRIESATGENTVAKGRTLPLRATVTFDSGESEQVTDDVKWSSSKDQVAEVDSGGEVEGIAAGTATITGTYKAKGHDEMSAEQDIEVTDTGSGESDQNSSGSQDTDTGSDTGQQDDTGSSSSDSSSDSGSSGSDQDDTTSQES